MMDLVKVTRVLEWPVPTTKKKVQSFLEFVNFYRRFIKGFSHLTRPLFNLTKNNSIFYWSSNRQTTFSALKQRITSAPILALPHNLKPFQIEADSPDFTTRAVLSQQTSEDDKWHPIAFLSKSLSPVEQNYKLTRRC
jgi:RNase H-like domain found in reverse transcriptase